VRRVIRIASPFYPGIDESCQRPRQTPRSLGPLMIAALRPEPV